jgi:hypothetical protein
VTAASNPSARAPHSALEWVMGDGAAREKASGAAERGANGGQEGETGAEWDGRGNFYLR